MHRRCLPVPLGPPATNRRLLRCVMLHPERRSAARRDQLGPRHRSADRQQGFVRGSPVPANPHRRCDQLPTAMPSGPKFAGREMRLGIGRPPCTSPAALSDDQREQSYDDDINYARLTSLGIDCSLTDDPCQRSSAAAVGRPRSFILSTLSLAPESHAACA